MAGIVGVLPSRLLDDVSQTLRSLLLSTKDQGLGWLSHVLMLLPDRVLAQDEKSKFLESFSSSEVQKSQRSFLRIVDDLADVCRRSRIVRQAAQTALTPETYL